MWSLRPPSLVQARMTTCKQTFTKNRELCKNTYLRYGQFVDVNVSMDVAGHYWTQVGKRSYKTILQSLGSNLLEPEGCTATGGSWWWWRRGRARGGAPGRAPPPTAAWGTPWTMEGWTAVLDILLLWCLCSKWKISHNFCMLVFVMVWALYLFCFPFCIFFSDRVRDWESADVFGISSPNDRNIIKKYA